MATIRTFYVPFEGTTDVIGIAVDELGVTLSSHYSSSPSWALHDISADHHHAKYNERYPDGWGLQWLGDDVPADWDGEHSYKEPWMEITL